MRFYFSPRITIIGLLLVAGMVRASVWQWHRHLEKQVYIEDMGARMTEPPVPIETVIATNPEWGSLAYRRVMVTGTWDFEREMVLRNRRLDDEAGVHVITPLKLSPGGEHILVSRGFIPLGAHERESRRAFQRAAEGAFIGLVKESASRRLLAPADPPTGPELPWADAWLRVDVPAMSRQLPYPVLPVYLELMESPDAAAAQEKIVTSSSEREELLMMGLSQIKDRTKPARALSEYPVPSFDTVIPPGRHFGYVFEWAGMALLTVLICLVLQLRPWGQPPPLPLPGRASPGKSG